VQCLASPNACTVLSCLCHASHTPVTSAASRSTLEIHAKDCNVTAMDLSASGQRNSLCSSLCLLLQKGNTALHLASSGGHIMVVRELLRVGARAEGRNQVKLACCNAAVVLLPLHPWARQVTCCHLPLSVSFTGKPSCGPAGQQPCC
jgi:hypothetical protein